MTQLKGDLRVNEVKKDDLLNIEEFKVEEKSVCLSVKSIKIKENNLKNLKTLEYNNNNINCSQIDLDQMSTISYDSKCSQKKRYSFKKDENEQEINLSDNKIIFQGKNFEHFSSLNNNFKQKSEINDNSFTSKKKLNFSKIEMQTICDNNHNYKENSNNKNVKSFSSLVLSNNNSSEIKK